MPALGFAGRRRWLEKYRDWLLDHEDELHRLVQDETDKTWGDLALGEVTAAVDVLNYYAARAEGFFRPTRSCPDSQMLDVPAALMAGCAVLTKASEETPLAWEAAVAGWRAIDAPDVLGVVSGRGTAGAAVVEEVDMIQFTGTVETGRRIGNRAAEGPVRS